MKKYMLITFAASILIFFLSAKIATTNDEKTIPSEIPGSVTLALSEIRHDLEMFHIINSKPTKNPELVKELGTSLIRKILIIRTLNPDIEQLTGKSLETFCLLNEGEAKKLIKLADDIQLSNLANQYIRENIEAAKKRITNFQKSMKGKGCHLSPQSNN